MKIPTEAIEEKATEEVLLPLETDVKERMRRDLEAAGIDPNKYLPKEEEEPIECVWRIAAPPL